MSRLRFLPFLLVGMAAAQQQQQQQLPPDEDAKPPQKAAAQTATGAADQDLPPDEDAIGTGTEYAFNPLKSKKASRRAISICTKAT